MKILLFLLLLFITTDVNALTHYSDYSEFSSWQEEEVIEDDLTEVESEVRYKWFNEEKIYGDYEEDNKYPLIDYDDYKISEYCTSEYRDEAIKTYFCYYKDPLPINYVYFMNLEDDITFETLEIYGGRTKINYEVYNCEDCLYDNTELVGVKKGGEIVLKLSGSYSPPTLKFIIKTTNDAVYNLFIATKNNYDYQYKYQVKDDFVELEFDYFTKANPLYYQENKKEIDVNMFIPGREVRIVTEYCSIKKEYRRYKVIKHYSNDYMVSGSDEYPLMDDSNSKTYYRYRKRNYLDIPENIVITDKNTTLESLITSNLEFTIETSLNKDINGEYQFIVNSPVLKVIDKVKVEILDNKKILELESVIDDKETQIKKNADTIAGLLLEIDNLKELNKYLDNEKILLEATNKSNSENYIEEIARINNQVKTKVKVVEKEPNYNILYYLGIGLIVVSVGLSFILVAKKNS